MSHFEYNGPINRNPGPNEVGIIVYGYWPSLALGAVGVATFGLAMVINAYYAYRKRGMYRTFSGLMAGGCLAEVGGYATRIFSHYKPFNLSAYIASSTMIILAPVIFAAAIDFSLNIVAEGFAGSEGILLLSPRNILIVFISTDVFAITIQGVGASLVGYTTSTYFNDGDPFIQYEQANNILIAGLTFQIAAWLIFIIFLLVSMYRAHTRPLYASAWYDNLRRMLWLVLTATILLLWRASYRLAEVILGYLSGPATREDYLASFEYLPVILAIILLTALPPHWFVERRRKGQAPDGFADGRGASASASAGANANANATTITQGDDVEEQGQAPSRRAGGAGMVGVEPVTSADSVLTAVNSREGSKAGY